METKYLIIFPNWINHRFFYKHPHEKYNVGDYHETKPAVKGIYEIEVNAENSIYYNEKIGNTCPYKNIRFHQVNVRLIKGSILSIMTNIYMSQTSNYWRQFLVDSINYINEHKNSYDVDNDVAIIQIKKQINNISSNYDKMKDVLFSELDYNIEKLKYYLSIVPVVDSLNMLKEMAFQTQEWFNYWKILVPLTLYFFQDLYFLSRCFREFNIVRRNIPRDSCKYIVIYVGDVHVENTKEILMNNGGELVKEIRNKNPNFIKIRDNKRGGIR